MSVDRPPTPQRRELEIMQVLFERRLKDRAIALADSRFPGAGKMVDLAYEWGELDPGERRDRLSAIGPDEIAKFRDFAELNPDLSKAVDELDRRGVLPHLENAATEVAAASQQAQAEQAASTTQAEQPKQEGQEAKAPEAAEPPSNEPVTSTTPETDADFDELDINPLHVDMPDLDLGLPSTSEFLEDETGRREEAARSADEAMERVRKSLDAATQRAFDRSSNVGVTKMPEISRPTLPSLALQEQEADSATEQAASKAIAAPDKLARHLEQHAIAMIRADEARPTPDQLVALANERQIGYSEHTISLENRKEAFGGLVSEFGRITVKPGAIPKAVAAANLVVIHGRLAPQIADRIEEGFLDIPGTRASVKVHPDARIVVLGS